MRLFHVVFFCALVFFMAFVLGCPVGKSEKAPAPDKTSTTPQRIVSFAPNITETIFALGFGSHVVGVTDFCDYPPETANIQKVGGHINPDLEAVALLRPDLIVVQGVHEKVAQFAELHQIPLTRVNMDTIASIDEGIQILGEALGCTEKAAALREQIRKDLEDIRTRVSGLPIPRVLIITTRQSHDFNNLYTLGAASFMSELLEIAGGKNVFADAKQAYYEASKESVVARAPEVILEFHAGESLTPEEQERYRNDWQAFPSLPAVQQGRIYLIMESHALRPGPRIPEIARILAERLHPEAFETKQP